MLKKHTNLSPKNPKRPCNGCGVIGIEKFRLGIDGHKLSIYCLKCQVKRIKFKPKINYNNVPINRKPCTVCGKMDRKKFRYHFDAKIFRYIKLYKECHDCYCKIRIDRLYKSPFGNGDDMVFDKFVKSIYFKKISKKISELDKKKMYTTSAKIRDILLESYITALEKNVSE